MAVVDEPAGSRYLATLYSSSGRRELTQNGHGWALIDGAREPLVTTTSRGELEDGPAELGMRMERSDSLTHVVILGSTGSIGRSAMSVIEHDGASDSWHGV